MTDNIIINNQLLQNASKGDRKAQYRLFKYCFTLLMPVCYRYTNQEELAREELNQAFTKIIFGLKKYEDKIPFDAWAKRIAINSIIDNHRKNKKHKYQEDVTDIKTEYKLNHVNSTEEKINYDEILALLEQIPESSKQVFKLYIIEGYNHKEIAEIMNFSEGNSKWHLSVAREKMRILINKTKQTILTVLL